MEYEFDVFADVDWSHVMTVTKSRCPAIDGAIIAKPGPEFMSQVVAWLNGGVDARPATFTVRPALSAESVNTIMAAAVAAGMTTEKLKEECFTRYSFREPADLTPEQAFDLIERLKKRRKVTTTPAPSAEPTPVPAPSTNGNGHVTPNAPAAPTSTPSPTAGPQPKPGCANAAQLARLGELRRQLFDSIVADRPESTDDELRATWAAILSRRNVTTAFDLTPEQADELIKTLTTKLFKEVAIPQLEEAFRAGNNPGG
jgi:hypothetical protein